MNFLICVNNKGYEASLEVRKLYRCLDDAHADALDMVRVVDESGEDYLYPAKRFQPNPHYKAAGTSAFYPRCLTVPFSRPAAGKTLVMCPEVAHDVMQKALAKSIRISALRASLYSPSEI